MCLQERFKLTFCLCSPRAWKGSCSDLQLLLAPCCSLSFPYRERRGLLKPVRTELSLFCQGRDRVRWRAELREEPWRVSTPAPAASSHGQGAQQLPPAPGPGTGAVTTRDLAIPTTPLMSAARSAKTCLPNKVSSALSLHGQAAKMVPAVPVPPPRGFPTGVLNPQPGAALCQGVWRAGVLQGDQLEAVLSQPGLGPCRG